MVRTHTLLERRTDHGTQKIIRFHTFPLASRRVGQENQNLALRIKIQDGVESQIRYKESSDFEESCFQTKHHLNSD